VLGVPEIAPVFGLKARPSGSVPTMLHVNGAVPPDAFRIVLYAAPTAPRGGAPEITGSGLTVMLAMLALAVPLIVAVKVTFIWLAMPAGAVYVTTDPVVLEREPQAAAEHEPPEIVHDTGASPDSAAVI